MKALVLEEYLKFAYRDVDDPTIGADEVLIEVKACGICGSDVHGVDGSTGRRIPPIIMGHEASGIIRERGKGVTEWARDERVTFDSTIYCGVCWHCRRWRNKPVRQSPRPGRFLPGVSSPRGLRSVCRRAEAHLVQDSS